jgi:hypothetical protein
MILIDKDKNIDRSTHKNRLFLLRIDFNPQIMMRYISGDGLFNLFVMGVVVVQECGKDFFWK